MLAECWSWDPRSPPLGQSSSLSSSTLVLTTTDPPSKKPISARCCFREASRSVLLPSQSNAASSEATLFQFLDSLRRSGDVPQQPEPTLLFQSPGLKAVTLKRGAQLVYLGTLGAGVVLDHRPSTRLLNLEERRIQPVHKLHALDSA